LRTPLGRERERERERERKREREKFIDNERAFFFRTLSPRARRVNQIQNLIDFFQSWLGSFPCSFTLESPGHEMWHPRISLAAHHKRRKETLYKGQSIKKQKEAYNYLPHPRISLGRRGMREPRQGPLLRRQSSFCPEGLLGRQSSRTEGLLSRRPSVRACPWQRPVAGHESVKRRMTASQLGQPFGSRVLKSNGKLQGRPHTSQDIGLF